MSAITLTRQAVSVTCSEVDTALIEVANRYPELERCMKVARAMLCRLDTIRDEAKLGACIAKQNIACGRSDDAAGDLVQLVDLLGKWDRRHELML